jgi:Gram-negative bacterial TonB protein C-terminal
MKKTLIFIITFLTFLFQSVSGQNKVPKIPQVHICNGLATYLPKPKQSKPSEINASGVVLVQVSINEQGNVESANAVSGHSLLRSLAEKAALKAKFRQTTFSGNPIKVNCAVIYNFIPDESSQIKQTELPKGKPIKDAAQGILTGKVIKLPKPPVVSCNCKFGSVGNISSVIVLADIDEQGNVIKAIVVSGHPILKTASQKAAEKSKFNPTLLSGIPTKVRRAIVYKFKVINKWSAKITKIEIVYSSGVNK